jgi:hypothetical protein
VIGDEPNNTEQDPELPIKLYRKAKNGGRHQVSSHGTRPFPEERVFGCLGVLRLQGPMGARS